jgi:peroxiredoxin
MPSYEEDLSAFERRNAQVLGISTDQIASNEAWAKSMGGLSYPLLSDHYPHGQVAALYGVLRGDNGLCQRSIFVVDKEGKVAYVDIRAQGEQPPSDGILAALDRLQGQAGGSRP